MNIENGGHRAHVNGPRKCFNPKSIRSFILSILILVVTIPCSALADEQNGAPSSATAAKDSGELVEIIVTAEKRPESISKTPIAVSVLSQEQLTEAGVHSVSDLTTNVPNVQIHEDPVSSGVIVTVRGITNKDVSEDGDPAVATYVDGVYLNRAQGLSGTLYDLERVEVLRGPQGTLYGRNATGGNLNLITADPKNYFAAGADVSYGNFGDIQTHGMVNVPVSDDLAIRASYSTHRNNGVLNDEGTTAQDYGMANDYGFRLTALWSPTTNFSWRLSFEDQEQHGTPLTDYVTNLTTGLPLDGLPVYKRPLPNYPEPYLHVFNRFIHSRMTWNITPELSLVYIAGYEDLFDDTQEFAGVFDANRRDGSQFYSHELNVIYDYGSLHNIVGASYFHQVNEENDAYEFPTIDSAFDGGVRANLDEAFGVFDQATYDLTERLHLTAGLRYSSEHKNRNSEFSEGCPFNTSFAAMQAAGPTGTNLPPGCTWSPAGGTGHWSSVNWKAGVSYNLSDNTLSYVSVATGFKAGGLNNAGTPVPRYAPETVTNYELGVKTRLMDNRVSLNADVFDEEYKDLQLTQVFGTPPNLSTLTTNAGAARIYGVEIDGSWKITRNDRLEGFANYLNAKYTNYLNAPSFGGPPSLPDFYPDLDGKHLINSPTVSFRLQYSHDFKLSDGATIRPMAAVYWQGDSYLRPFNELVDRVPAYSKTNLNLIYMDSTNHWTVQGYVDNLENNLVRTDGSTGFGVYFSDYMPPRTYGVRVSYQY